MNSSNNNSDTYDTPQTSTRNIEPVFDLKTKLQNLKNNDPDFNPHVFLDKASTVFFQIQYAWCNRNMDPVREYVSESIFLRFSLQIQQYLKNHKINKLDELSLDHINIIDITSDENFDTIFVAITATARDYVTDDQDNMISGSNTLTSWNEKWEFIRSTKAKTILKDGTQTIKCPNCGAPIQLNTSSECEYCHSRLIQSDFDWIISEIIQLD